MRTAEEYRDHAAECRQLAARMETGEQRALLLKMAADWEEMAGFRETLVERHPELRTESEA